MKTAEQIAQWVIDNRYPKSENNKVSDSEMYHELVESIAKLCTISGVIKSVCDDCTAYPFDKRGKTPICKTCKDNPSKTVL